ncbi:hypothetical protein BZ160_02265 [Pantoea vagans]|nr:hypothetical protein BZ160_02265 [Pantoea vagans]
MLTAPGNDYSQAYKTGYRACDEQKMGSVIVRTVDYWPGSGAKRFSGSKYRMVNFPGLKG